jgi:hypothetical protein
MVPAGQIRVTQILATCGIMHQITFAQKICLA